MLDIKNAVIHILDRDSDQPVLNDFSLELGEDLQAFLEKHITRGMNDEDTRKARFREGRNIINEVCFRIENDEGYFLEGSREIARQLFRAMKTNSSISSTDLVICHYEDAGQGYTAILKMDYTTTYIHEIEFLDNKYRINIRRQDISLPGPGQKVQKCAFVKAVLEDDGCNLLILDNQINAKEKDEPVARFFLQTFLGAELISDSRASTKAFKRETENWIREKAEEGDYTAEMVRELVNSAIRKEEEIDIVEFSERAFGNRVELRDEFIRDIKEKGIEETFNVDRDWVDRKLSRIRLKTEGNVEIILDYEDFTDREKFEIRNNNDGTRNIIIKNVVSIFEK